MAFSAQLESRRPDVVRIDRVPGGPAVVFTVAVTPLAPGTAYIVASASGTRDSVLVTVQ